MSPFLIQATSACAQCGTEISALSCPNCGRLRYSAELEDLAKRARDAAQVGDLRAARDLWNQALPLLPPDTVQYRTIEQRIKDLTAQIDAAEAPQAAKQTGWKKTMAGGAGPALLLLLSKGKLILLGLTKLSTLLSMFAFFGVYWSMYGWAFALGLVLSIYIHEMGHVTLLRSYGIPASAPMFIPGFGAFISVRGRDARAGAGFARWTCGAAIRIGLGASLLPRAGRHRIDEARGDRSRRGCDQSVQPDSGLAARWLARSAFPHAAAAFDVWLSWRSPCGGLRRRRCCCW